jgi:hypothetical protein
MVRRPRWVPVLDVAGPSCDNGQVRTTGSDQQTARGCRPVKVVILAGGLGARLAEETEVRPKPMVEIGGRPNPETLVILGGVS